MDDIDGLIARYAGRVPRYTSYPTAPHFTPAVDGAVYADWLARLPESQALSLYIHVPFCDVLCLYCGCNTTVAHRPEPLQSYAQAVITEIRLAAERIGRRARIRHVHWGGGTPTALPADELMAIWDRLTACFDIAPDAEIAVEIDPRVLKQDRLAALAAMGVNRASIGVQDFAPEVQKAVGRIQSFETTAKCVEMLRTIGVASLNADLIYGLPLQTVESVVRTAHQTLALGPDRLAVFGYAHVPWMKKHQRLLPEDKLPDARARFAQQAAIGSVLTGSGFRAIGLDHYARPDDSLARAAANGRLRRNFQGYTTDAAPVLIGFGASAIGSLPEGYAQNAPSVPVYKKALAESRLPVARGIALSAEDRLRRDVIETLMCRLSADIPDIAARHDGSLAPPDSALRDMATDDIIEWDGQRITVTERGRPFLRSVAGLFDEYLAADGTARHSAGV